MQFKHTELGLTKVTFIKPHAMAASTGRNTMCHPSTLAFEFSNHICQHTYTLTHWVVPLPTLTHWVVPLPTLTHWVVPLPTLTPLIAVCYLKLWMLYHTCLQTESNLERTHLMPTGEEHMMVRA